MKLFKLSVVAVLLASLVISIIYALNPTPPLQIIYRALLFAGVIGTLVYVALKGKNKK